MQALRLRNKNTVDAVWCDQCGTEETNCYLNYNNIQLDI